MLVYNQHMLERYLSDDWVLRELQACDETLLHDIDGHRWLCEDAAKRLAYSRIYGDLLNPGGLAVIDVGAGLNGLTSRLVKSNDYTAIDLHDYSQHPAILGLEGPQGPSSWVQADWVTVDPFPIDVAIAVDIFPNVDQRLELFLSQWLPVSKQVRLLLTYFNRPKTYTLCRADGDEVMTILAWTGQQLDQLLTRYHGRVTGPIVSLASSQESDSIHANGRSVCEIVVQGDRA